MIRERRYLIFKLKDVRMFLSQEEMGQLDTLADKIEYGRKDIGKEPLECVVVESDWPEYEPTWDAIEKRVEGEQA